MHAKYLISKTKKEKTEKITADHTGTSLFSDKNMSDKIIKQQYLKKKTNLEKIKVLMHQLIEKGKIKHFF